MWSIRNITGLARGKRSLETTDLVVKFLCVHELLVTFNEVNNRTQGQVTAHIN